MVGVRVRLWLGLGLGLDPRVNFADSAHQAHLNYTDTQSCVPTDQTT